MEKTAASVTPFEQVREEIQRRLAQQRYAQEYESYVEGLRKTATIDVRVREVPLQVDRPTLGSAPLQEGPPSSGVAPLGETVSPPPAVPAAPGGDASEFETTPQAGPERVAPAPPPTASTPTASPSPAPSPQARS
jgi:hypothetical protein